MGWDTPSKLSIFPVGSWPPVNYASLGLSEYIPQNGMSIGKTISVGLTDVTTEHWKHARIITTILMTIQQQQHK